MINKLKAGYVSIEVIVLTSIIVIFGLMGYMHFSKDARKNLNTSHGIMGNSIKGFDVKTETRY